MRHLDESTTIAAKEPTAATRRGDGFPGQRMRVLPRPLVRHALTLPVLRTLLVTDAGFFPRALAHGRRRTRGSEQTIVIVCSGGRGWLDLDGVRHGVGAGQVVVIPPLTPHSYEADPSDPWTIWWFHVAGSSVADLLALRAGRRAAPVEDLPDAERVVSLVDTLVRRMERDESMSGLLVCTGIATHALMLVAAGARPGERASRADPVAVALEHLAQNPATRLSVAELAGLTGLSGSHFSALFRRHTGFGPLEYQTRQRMARARELLDTTEETVERIAAHVGYSDPMYFSRHFRRLHGTSPTQYRREHRG